jgi:hypothetical protein
MLTVRVTNDGLGEFESSQPARNYRGLSEAISSLHGSLMAYFSRAAAGDAEPATIACPSDESDSSSDHDPTSKAARHEG